MYKKLGLIGLAASISLVGCSEKSDSKAREETTMQDEHQHKEEHSGTEKVPADLQKAKHPHFKVGSEAIITSDHMEGMKGAQATVEGAYNTVAYVVSYKPTTGGKTVKNHKWVIQEEIKNAENETTEKGDKVIIKANHMKGMKGAEATIVSAKETTVYMVSYTSKTSGEELKNHKWVTEDELEEIK
ncbi:YdhK family protein [Priestia endophytica]|jgi:hypothetical protein|uniref:YdhK family protein n=1 Tax=Priestia endophytica TaxID=135735 RepID=UPI00124DE023|nr:YdhK family protein [Priestia endophytica]KAB2496113.1 YdhK family protein [Priestia endophytica]